MLRKSPYVSENFKIFYTREWDSQSSSSSQEALNQTLNFMQSLCLDQNLQQQQQQQQQHPKQYEPNWAAQSSSAKRTMHQSAFDDTSNRLLAAKLISYPQQSQNTNYNNNNNSDHQNIFVPQACSYCKLHFDQILLLKHQTTSSETIQSNKPSSQKRLDAFFTTKQRTQMQQNQQQQQQQQSQHQQHQYLQPQLNSSIREQVLQKAASAPSQSTTFVQQVLCKSSQSKLGLMRSNETNNQNPNGFSMLPPPNEDDPMTGLFSQCEECGRSICFACIKKCQNCDKAICPLPLCSNIKYGQQEDILECSGCFRRNQWENNNITNVE